MSAMRLFSKLSFFFLSLLLALNCDVVLGQNRIIGGKESDISKVPFLVEITLYGRNYHIYCGAFIISKSWAVSAAHCFVHEGRRITANSFLVISGSTYADNMISQNKKPPKYHNITEYHVHEKYSAPNNTRAAFDITVFKVNTPFVFDEVTQPAKLPDKLVVDGDQFATIVGWGCTEMGGRGISKLLYARVMKDTQKRCMKFYPHIVYVNSVVCYGPTGRDHISNTCKGDSGGPLIVGKDLVIGIVSMSKAAGPQYPGLFTSTAFFRNWIKQKTGV